MMHFKKRCLKRDQYNPRMERCLAVMLDWNKNHGLALKTSIQIDAASKPVTKIFDKEDEKKIK